MPIRSVYNDPAMAQAFSNLSSMFAPPSGGDAAGWANAAATREKAARLAQLFSNPNDPNFDRQNIAVGNYAPTQSFYAQDQNDLTAKRGQDVGAETARRGQDIGADTSIKNNVADNARAIEAAKLGEQGKVVQSMIAPLNEGQTRAPGLSKFFLPGLPENNVGAMKLNRGETVDLPGGQRLQGAPMPISHDELVAQILGRQPVAAQDAAVLSQTPVEEVMGPDGPTRVARSDSVGKPLYQKPTTTQEANGTYYLPDGSTGPAEKRADGWYDAQTGKRLPDTGLKITRMGQPQGSLQDITGRPTESSDKDAMFYTRGQSAAQTFDTLAGKGYTVPSVPDFELGIGSAGDALPLSLSNKMMSTEGKLYSQAAHDFVQAILRPDTGAAFGNKEIRDYGRVFLPIPGDPPEVLAAKKQSRDIAMSALAGNSRGGAERLIKLLQSQGLPVSPGLQRFLATQTTQAPGGAAPVAPVGGPPAAAPAPAAAVAAPPAPPAASGPKAGDVEDGYVFNGGDAADPKNWSPVK